MADQNTHALRSFDQELKQLHDMIAAMGGLVERELMLATAAVLEHDSAAATQAVEIDPQVDAIERDVEKFVIRTLALRQPVADDLRQVVTALKITHDLERIGDYAANVAKRSIVLAEFAAPFNLGGLAHMARLVQEALKYTIDAIGTRDTDLAMQVWQNDSAIDDLYTTIFRELITYMMEDPRNITPCTHLLFVAKNLERIGDHATNIAETLYYAVKGENVTTARPKSDTSPYASVRARELSP